MEIINTLKDLLLHGLLSSPTWIKPVEIINQLPIKHNKYDCCYVGEKEDWYVSDGDKWISGKNARKLGWYPVTLNPLSRSTL